MQEITYDVPDVSCEHCVNAITKATTELGVSAVQVDLPSKKVYVAFDPAQTNDAAIQDAIAEEGYDIAGQVAGNAIPAGPGAGKKSLNLKTL